MRGFLGGLITGVVVLGGAAVVLSLMAPKPPRPDVSEVAPAEVPDRTEPETPGGTGVGASGQDADLVETAPVAPVTPTTQEAEPEGGRPLDPADTQPADKPQVGGASQPQAAEPQETEAPDVPQGDTPVTPPAETSAPAEPDQDASANVEPSSPRTQPSAMTDSGSAPEAPKTDETPPEIAAVPAPPEGGAAPTAPGVPAPSAESDPEISTEPATPPQETSAKSADQEPPAAGAPPASGDSETPAKPALPRVAALPQASPGAEEGQTGSAQEGEPQGEEPQARPGFGTPVVPLTERNGGSSLVGTAPEPETVGASEPTAAPAMSALDRFSVPFNDPGDRPLMSILLIDETGSIGAEALREFPYPLSFAVDPSDPEAARKMAAYRDAGFEVTLLANLPAAATAQDAEVSLAVWMETLPEIVAIVEGTGSGIQGNRALSDQVAAIAGSAGMGLVTQSNGLNTVQKLALRNGVPATVVFRDFDGAGQTPTVMRRFLDQAAFRAGQEGAVIMLGRVQPDTISALLLWGLQDRAQRVALAPLSAVLRRVVAAPR